MKNHPARGKLTGSPGLRGWWARISESIDARLWPVPVAAILVAVVVGYLMTRLDVRVDEHLPSTIDALVFNGGADTARSVLSAIAGSLVTATSLTFSLTVVALQLASSQASPRVLRLFARDRHVHWTLAAFLGTFAYSLTVLRSVRSDTETVPEFVPRISVTLAFVLTLVSVIMLVLFLAHLAAQLRVETMLKEIHAETDRIISLVGDRNAAFEGYAGAIEIPEDAHTVASSSSGFITGHDHERLITLATRHSIVVQEVTRVGASIVAGMPVARWWRTEGAATDIDVDAVAEQIRAAYTIGYERTAAQDVDYGVQQIVDIAVRALSPGVNDPTTAINALGHLSALVPRLVHMTPMPRGLRGSDGQLCLVTRARHPEDDIDAALSQIRHYGAADPSVVSRFLQTVTEISTLCESPRVQRALLDQLDALAEQVRAADGDPAASVASLTSVGHVRAAVVERSVSAR